MEMLKKNIRPKIMLMSLGGTPEPLIKSIAATRPEKIVFLASHVSTPLSGQIFKSLDFKPATEFVITEDPNLLYECYRAARGCVERIRKSGHSPDEVLVDYTGGTKVMTAALILATVGLKYSFNYVGGELRNKNGLGTVIDGQEKMFAEMSPWSVFAEEERRQVKTLFNHRRYFSVKEIIDNARKRELPRQIRDYFNFVLPLSEGFLKWDQFEHVAAFDFLKSGHAVLSNYIDTYPEPSLEPFSANVLECIGRLQEIMSQTCGMNKFHLVMIGDLLNNARRKIEDKRHDDAAARIYRALELYGQVIFEEVAGCGNDRVKLEIIPEKLKKEFQRKYQDPHSKSLKLPLSATFGYLKVMGHEAGNRFFDRLKQIKNIQSNRNDSILAHGIRPVSEKAVTSIFKTVSEFVEFKDSFNFPNIP
jgi:CRISPR-associated protein (TIGR02710 family)